MSLVGKQFPDITVKAINAEGDELQVNLSRPGLKKILFWYPKDFTFVCPTELHAFQNAIEEFNKRGVEVYGASCDTAEVHFAWLNTPKDDGGIEGVNYPLLSDTTRKLSEELDILDDESVTYRATYLIDETGKVYHESINDMPLGRNVDEYLRIIDAKLHNEKHGEVCPANWEEGKDAMSATREGVADYLSK